MKPLHIYDEIYLKNYYVMYGVTREEFKKAFFKYTPAKGYDFNVDKANGKTILCECDGADIIWIWTRHKDMAVLTHEIIHAIRHTLQNILPLNDETDETYAYLAGFLMRKILKKGGTNK